MMKKSSKRISRREALRKLKDGSLIREYQDMIYKIALDLNQTHPQESLDELVSEGFFALTSMIPRYNPKKAGLSTWLYQSVWSRMKNFCIDAKKNRHIYYEDGDPIFDGPDPTPWIMDVLQDLSDDAGEIVHTILNAPEALWGIFDEFSPKTSRKYLRRYMTKKWGGDQDRYLKAFEEITLCLSGN